MNRFSGDGMDPTFVPEDREVQFPHDLIHAIDGQEHLNAPQWNGEAGNTVEAEEGESVEETGMSEDDLKIFIKHRLENSHMWYGSGKLSAKRIEADRYYRGEPLGNEEEGRSEVVSRDVAEAVESAMPSLMRIFAGGEQVCQFEPFGPEDEEKAKEATDYINHIFMNENEGFMIIYTWIKDSLLKKNGIVKAWHETRMCRKKERYEGLTQEQVQSLYADQSIQVVSVEQYADQVEMPDPMTGLPMPQPITLYNCVVTAQKPEKRIRVMNVPPDEFIIERRATSIYTAGFLAHRGKRTINDLIECGHDPEKCKAIPRDDERDYTAERLERFNDEEQLPYNGESNDIDPLMRKVWVTEAYVQCDFDGDGTAEWRCVILAGDSTGNGIILSNEEITDHPFADLTPVPEPHKFYGQSLFDQTRDIQDIKTALIRGVLDSTYLANSPRYGVVEGKVNIDDFLDSRPGGAVRLKSADALVPIASTPVSAAAMSVIEYIDSVKQRRTGIDSNSQAGINPDVLNSSATGADIINTASQQRLELMARIMAETGVKRLFRIIFQLTCEYQDAPKVVRLRNKWINVDPRDWKDKMDVAVTVGIGLGSKAQQAAIARQLLEVDKTIIELQGGIDGPLVKIDNVYNKLVKLVEAVGYKNPDPYYNDPKNYQAPPPKPPTPEQQIHMQELQSKAVQASAQADKAKADSYGGIEMKRLDYEMKLLDRDIKLMELEALKLQTGADPKKVAARADNETTTSPLE